MMFAQYTLVFLLLAVYYGSVSVSALRFDLNPVTVDTEASNNIIGIPLSLRQRKSRLDLSM